eukprot:CAMPEP_0171158398 /NCGR_PEP_ID=MMETSP0790-20130122/2484_1 /TAXON_ID=2925 /ORGANISM="Alexandrium catenella, Strain OF101" /LENGTH=57 /DNA_ID=CAMNT_0011622825 /DNA_START=88 /DNA_END=258 /DNA_ORIENTATION=-
MTSLRKSGGARQVQPERPLMGTWAVKGCKPEAEPSQCLRAQTCPASVQADPAGITPK